MSRTSTLLALVATAALGLAITNADAKNYYIGQKHFGMKQHHGWKHHHQHWRHGLRYYPRPIYRSYRPLVAAPVMTTAPVSCLSKEYTPQGAVLFKDRCTSEWAMNPPMQGPAQ